MEILQVLRHIIKMCYLGFLLNPMFGTNVFAQGKEIIEKEICLIDSSLSAGIDPFKNEETLSALLLFSEINNENLFEDVHYGGKIKLVEYERFKKDYQKNEDYYARLVDSFISSLFIPHSIDNLACETIIDFESKYKVLFYLHKIDCRLEPHVFDFQNICMFHLKRIRNALKENSVYVFDNTGDCLFVEVIQLLSDSIFMHNQISPQINVDDYNNMESWCMKYFENPDLDILFFTAISDCVTFVDYFGFNYKYNVRKSILWRKTMEWYKPAMPYHKVSPFKIKSCLDGIND